MKSYPSILGSVGQEFREFDAYVFDKYDGSNLRAEYNKKRGFYKFGTRTRLFDETDEIFGKAVVLFRDLWEDHLGRVASDQRWDGAIIFCEFWGANSFAGLHAPDDTHTLTLFDVNPTKRGFLGPKDFLKLFGNLDNTARLLGQEKWTRGFVQLVREGGYPCSLEGVVGKAGSGHDQIRAKAKTQAWIDQVLARYGEEHGKKIIES